MRQQLVTFLLGEVTHDVRGEIFRPPLMKSAPLYSATAVPYQVVIGQEQAELDGQSVVMELRGYPPDILLIQSRIPVPDIFSKDIFDLEYKVLHQAHKIFAAHGGNLEHSEEYSVFVIAGYQGEPEQFLRHAPMMASLLKSERLELDPKEVEYTLRAQIKYAKNDLAIIDWDGAFLFDPEEDIEEDLELLTLANLQLLRHRMLDSQLDERLARVASLVRAPGEGKLALQNKELARDLGEIVRTRMASISQLQRLEQDIKLIGDWYSARFYELAAGKFKLDEWRKSILGKLDSLEDVYTIVLENFSVSGKQRAEWIQIIAFFILQIGWFALIILEAWHFTR